MQQYFKEIEDKVRVCYSIAEEARKKGHDPKSIVEIPIATNLAERVTGLISVRFPQVKNEKIVNRIKELEKEHGKLDPAVCLKIAEEIAKEKFCKFQSQEEAIDAAVRMGIAYITMGVVSSPLEGFTGIKLKKTKNNENFFACYYAGPIRSAGGTGAAFSLLIIDYLRELFGYAKYDSTDKENKRLVTELYDYHERVNNLQYLPSEQEIEILSENLPIMVTGDPSEEREVSNYKDLERIETNRIRSGPCLVIGEGLAQKAPKILRMLLKLREKGFKLSDWSFLEDFVKFQKSKAEAKKKESSGVYIQDIVAGRPIFSHPSRSGGFRLRYGRSRCSGYSATSVSPLTMILLDKFIAIGTQLKIEKPTKGCITTSCDHLDGPIIKTTNGDVVKISFENYEKYKNNLSEILYIGDILITYGDFINRNSQLLPPGYCEDYWFSELKKVKEKRLDPYSVNFEEAIKLSEENKIPLHPKYIFFWTQIIKEEFSSLLDLLKLAKIEQKIIIPYSKLKRDFYASGKRALELLGIEHEVFIENIIIKETEFKSILSNLGIDYKNLTTENFKEKITEIALKYNSISEEEQKNILSFINSISNFIIRDKSGTFIGARMGRPEKAKLRKLVGSPHVLFPVGQEGGRLRSVQEAKDSVGVKGEFPIYFCETCNKETIYYACETCNKETKKMYYCPACERKMDSDMCKLHGKIQDFMTKRVDIKYYLDNISKKMNIQSQEMPALIKGVRGTSSESHVPENLGKGILRALFRINVNKDGTVRYDATEAPFLYFKPKEVFTDIETLKKLGYDKDYKGKILENEEQILELKPQDILLPSCPDTLDENADDVFVNVSKFIDNLLVRLYGLKPFYEVKSREDLVGHLVACMAPHNCAAVVGRIIGFSKSQTLFASPYMHAAMRRDCDGDEATIMLLLDTLINFSREYLPSHRGGTQDAPLILNARIRPGEVDDMIFDMERTFEFPLEFYEAAMAGKHPTLIKIPRIKDVLDYELEPFKEIGFTHDTDDFNFGVTCSSYKKLLTMQEKVQREMELCEKIRAVDESDVARLIIERHLIRDIRGNLRKFSMQQFRCVKCNEKFRRPPLQGRCTKCQGKIIFTINQGGIIKYLEPAMSLANQYNIPKYTKQNLELTKIYIESIFGKEKEKQENINKWF
jgi:DNA polymerase II large subunit